MLTLLDSSVGRAILRAEAAERDADPEVPCFSCGDEFPESQMTDGPHFKSYCPRCVEKCPYCGDWLLNEPRHGDMHASCAEEYAATKEVA